LPLGVVDELNFSLVNEVIILDVIRHVLGLLSHFSILGSDILPLIIRHKLNFSLKHMVFLDIVAHWVELLIHFLSLESSVLVVSNEISSVELNKVVLILIIVHRMSLLIHSLGLGGSVLVIGDEFGTDLDHVVLLEIVVHWVLLFVQSMGVLFSVLFVGDEVGLKLVGLGDSKNKGDVSIDLRTALALVVRAHNMKSLDGAVDAPPQRRCPPSPRRRWREIAAGEACSRLSLH